MLRWPYAGKHQQLGRRNAPGAQNDLVTFYRDPLPAAPPLIKYLVANVCLNRCG